MNINNVPTAIKCIDITKKPDFEYAYYRKIVRNALNTRIATTLQFFMSNF